MQLFRLALTITYGAFLGIWVYTDQKNSGGLFGDLHSSIPFELLVLGLAIAVGFVVRRMWALLALLGPLLTLGYLQVTATSALGTMGPPRSSHPRASAFSSGSEQPS